MSKREKALAKLRQNPKNVRFDEIVTILDRLGFVKRQEGTSHAIFTLGRHIINVPRRQPFVLPVYVNKIIEVIDEMEEEVFSEDQ